MTEAETFYDAIMFKKIKSRIGVRFFAILTLIIILSVVPFTFITLQAINKYGLEVAEVNELRIRSLAFSYLKEITWERADRYQGFFDRDPPIDEKFFSKSRRTINLTTGI
jgi:hypothetical protein